MKAAVVREFGQPLVIEDRPIPEPGPGQITVKMEASGLLGKRGNPGGHAGQG